jgi:hypothetical protein
MPGGFLTYTLAYTNYGPSDAVSLLLTDELPTGVDFDHTYPDICTVVPGTHTVTCEPVSDLVAGHSAQVLLVVRVKEGVTQPLYNQVEITSDTPDPDDENDRSEETTNIDNVPPNLQWVSPVGNEGIYVVTVVPGQAITLTVIATDTYGIDHVRFTLWNHLRGTGVWVEVGNDYEGESGVYEFVWVLDSGVLELPFEQAQFYAYAYDTAGNYTRRRIWLVPYYVLLPILVK